MSEGWLWQGVGVGGVGVWWWWRGRVEVFLKTVCDSEFESSCVEFKLCGRGRLHLHVFVCICRKTVLHAKYRVAVGEPLSSS